MLLPWMRPWLTGKCFDFALALAEQVPTPYFIGIGEAEFPDHVGLQLEAGAYADVRGVQDRSAFLAHHAGPLVALTREVVALHCGVSNLLPPYHESADIAQARLAVQRAYPHGLREALARFKVN